MKIPDRLYIVEGSNGEAVWYVAGYAEKSEAEKHVDRAVKAAKYVGAALASNLELQEKGNPYDPDAVVKDIANASYRVVDIPFRKEAPPAGLSVQVKVD